VADLGPSQRLSVRLVQNHNGTATVSTQIKRPEREDRELAERQDEPLPEKGTDADKCRRLRDRWRPGRRQAVMSCS
jgi:hypothetical protein